MQDLTTASSTSSRTSQFSSPMPDGLSKRKNMSTGITDIIKTTQICNIAQYLLLLDLNRGEIAVDWFLCCIVTSNIFCLVLIVDIIIYVKVNEAFICMSNVDLYCSFVFIISVILLHHLNTIALSMNFPSLVRWVDFAICCIVLMVRGTRVSRDWPSHSLLQFAFQDLPYRVFFSLQC